MNVTGGFYGRGRWGYVLCILIIFINRSIFLQSFQNLEGQKFLSESYLTRGTFEM